MPSAPVAAAAPTVLPVRLNTPSRSRQRTGMTCNHCVHAIKEEVAAVPGVTGVELTLDAGKLDITSDSPVDFDRILEAVDRSLAS